jgi:hypothetical protein
MGNFAKDLTAEDAVAVREYLISRANALKSGGRGVGGPAAARPETGHAEH